MAKFFPGPLTISPEYFHKKNDENIVAAAIFAMLKGSVKNGVTVLVIIEALAKSNNILTWLIVIREI